MYGIAFVCWQDCPSNLPYDCGGALCTKDKLTCDLFYSDSVIGTLSMVANAVVKSPWTPFAALSVVSTFKKPVCGTNTTAVTDTSLPGLD